MKVKILGVRGEIEASAPRYSNHSGILIDNKILLDLGEKKFLRKKPKIILITHLHPDHAFFTRKTEQKLITKIPVYAPERHTGCPNIKLIKREQTILGYKITAVPTIHSKKVKSNAYVIEKSGKRLLYTGDMVWIKKTCHPLLRNLDLVITEASFDRKGGMVRRDKKTGQIFGHNGLQDFINIFKKFTGRIVFMHFGGWLYKDIGNARHKIEKSGKQGGVKAEAGYDGMEIKV